MIFGACSRPRTAVYICPAAVLPCLCSAYIVGRMRQTLAFPAGRARPSDGRVRRRLLTAPFAGVLAAAALLFAPALASADTSSTLTVVGTSDVSDSGLVPNVIMPQFKTAFPQFSFHYVGSATGAAIQAAENGTGGPSALIVHAASLENQFVAQGFSFNNQFGNAIFTNDFVLAGNDADPAGVLAGAPHNIAQAFADVATAGQAGTATYYSRGGTTNASGTTVEEHALWALVDSSGLGSSPGAGLPVRGQRRRRWRRDPDRRR